MKKQRLKNIQSMFGLLTAFVLVASAACLAFTGRASAAIEQWQGGNVTAIAANWSHTCAIESGSLYCWGNGANAELGTGSPKSYAVDPVAVDTSGVLAGKTATHIEVGSASSCAIAGGQAFCWGREQNEGKFGNGPATGDFNSPIAVDTSGVLNGKTLVDISISNHTCAVDTDGQAYCWGSGLYGELGDGDDVSRHLPVAVDMSGALSGKTVTAISAGNTHTCAIADGEAYCWGNNSSGELGDGTGTSSDVPVAVDVSGALSGKTVTAISAGNTHTCAIADGEVFCWGDNSNGKLGDGTVNGSDVPVAVDTSGVLGGKTITDVSVGPEHTCVVADGEAYCWGENLKGRLGDGSMTPSNVPVAVDTSGVLSGVTVTSISAGDAYTCAIADSHAYCWGDNTSYQLGRMTELPPANPFQNYEINPIAVSTIQPEITGFSYATEGGRRLLKVTGAWDFDPGRVIAGEAVVMMNGSLVPVCTNSTYTAAAFASANVPPEAYSDDPMCWDFIEYDGGFNPIYNIWYTYASIWLPDGFDEANGVTSLEVFGAQYNSAAQPPFVTAQVDGRPFTGTPEISAQPTFQGTATPNSQVAVTLQPGSVTCDTTSDGAGNWSCTLGSDLAAGTYSISIQVTAPDNQSVTIGPYAARVLGTSSDLAETGLYTLLPVGVALLLVCGAFGVFLRWRRKYVYRIRY